MNTGTTDVFVAGDVFVNPLKPGDVCALVSWVINGLGNDLSCVRRQATT